MKRHTIPCIVSFGLGFILGYLIVGYPIFVDIIKLIVAGISAGLTIQAIQTFKEIKEKRLIHSKVLIDNNPNGRTNTSICFEHDNTLDLSVKTNYPSVSTPSDEWHYPYSSKPFERYSKEIDAHLKSGYLKEVWNHGTERDKFIAEHNAMAQVFLNNLNGRIISEIKKANPSLIEWDGKRQSPTKYFQPMYIAYDVCHVAHGFYERMFDLDKYYVIKQENNRWILITNYVLATSDNEKEMQEIKQVITTILNDAFAEEEFKMLKKYREDIKEKHDHYINGVDERKKEVDNGIPLKGHCRFCA